MNTNNDGENVIPGTFMDLESRGVRTGMTAADVVVAAFVTDEGVPGISLIVGMNEASLTPGEARVAGRALIMAADRAMQEAPNNPALREALEQEPIRTDVQPGDMLPENLSVPPWLRPDAGRSAEAQDGAGRAMLEDMDSHIMGDMAMMIAVMRSLRALLRGQPPPSRGASTGAFVRRRGASRPELN